MFTGGRTVRSVINRASRTAVYRQLAGFLRTEIASGRIPPGRLLPFEGRLAQEHNVSKQTVRKALDVLRAEGLVATERGYGTWVVDQQARQHIKAPRAARIVCRMPTESEREELGIELGEIVPVIVIHVGAQVRGPYRADQFDVTTA